MMLSGAPLHAPERLSALRGAGAPLHPSERLGDRVEALRALGFPVAMVSLIEGLQARPVCHAGSDALLSSMNVALPFVIEAARGQTKAVAWSSVGRPAVREALAGRLQHAMSLPIHGPGSVFVLVTVGGAPAVGADGISAALTTMRDIGWSVLDELAGVFRDRQALPLTECQIETLRLLACGLRHSEIASRCGVSVTAVKTRLTRAMNALGARSSASAVAAAILSGQLRASVGRRSEVR